MGATRRGGAIAVGLSMIGAALSAQSIDYSRIGIEAAGQGFRGIVECRSDLELAFPVAGIVAQAPAEEGAHVKAGDLLLSLQQTVETIELRRREEVLQDTADLDAVQAQLALAETQLAAAIRIFEQSRGISQEEVANRQLQYDLLVAEQTRIQSQERIEALDLDAARETLRRRNLHAPTDGTVSLKLRDVGEAVQPSDVVMRLCDTSELFLVTNIPAARAAHLAEGDRLTLTGTDPLAGRDTALVSEVSFLSPVVDPASGLQRIRVHVLDPPDWLKPGASLSLTFEDS